MNDKIEILNKKYDEFTELINNNNKTQNEEFENKLLIKENEINNKIKVLIKEDINVINNKIKIFSSI